MTTDIMIGVDLAKNVFQLHAAGTTGAVSYRKKLSREKFRSFMAQQAPAVVVMEACGSAHYWARELTQLGHEVKLIAPHYVRQPQRSSSTSASATGASASGAGATSQPPPATSPKT